MKLQIISKQVKDHPLYSNRDSILSNTTINRNQLDRKGSNMYSQYYPIDNKYQPSKEQIRGNPQDFFNHFQYNSSVVYQKVIHEKCSVHRKLEQTLIFMKPTPVCSPKNVRYEFSFKKGDTLASTTHSKENTETNQPQKLNYFLNQPRTKIRKFHSLAALKNSDIKREKTTCQGQKIELRKNCSLVKYNYSGYVTRERQEVTNKQNENRLNADYLGVEQINSRPSNLIKAKADKAFEQQKQRLARIRSELNEIYQMRKPLRLKLF